MSSARRVNSPQRTEALLKHVLQDLQRQGILPKKATIAQLKDMARKAAEETLRASNRLAKLGTGPKTGKQAVDESRYLLDLLTGGSQGSVASLFVHRIKDHVFHLRGGVWVDSRCKTKEKAKTDKLEVKAFSKEYFESLKQHPELAPFLAFSSRILVVLDDVVIEVIDES
jgi:hypothetical protein